MYRNFSPANSQLDKVMTNEQFNQIVDAIISGKYSWACLLILRFAGYNPLHYIPYRTYNRLMKTHRENNSSANALTASSNQEEFIPQQSDKKSATKLRDLCYLEEANQSEQVKGGIRKFPLGILPGLIFSRAENS